MLNIQEENKIRTNAAEYDLRIARQHGEMMIGQTLIGNVTIRYNERIYTITGELTIEEILNDENAQAPILASGKKSEVIEKLKEVYEIIQ